jgi:hypothetical protein
MDGYTKAVTKQRLGKHVPAAMNPPATIEFLLEKWVFVRGPCRGVRRKKFGATESVLYGSLRREELSV